MSQAAVEHDWRQDAAPLLIALTAAVAAIALRRAEVLAVVAAAPLIWAAMRRHDAAVIAVVAVLYTNAAIVAVKFHGAPKALAMAVPAPLLLALYHHLVRRQRPVIVTRTLPWFAAFLFLQTLSFLLARNPASAWTTMQVGILEGLFLYLLLTNAIRSRKLLRQLAWTVAVAGALMGLLSLVQATTGSYHNDFGGFAQISEGRGVGVETARGMVHSRRLCGPIGEQNRYAQVLLMLLPLGYCFMRAETRRSRKGLMLICLLLIGAGCMLTYSRGAMVAIGFTILLMGVMRAIPPRHLALAAVAACLLVAASPSVQKRLLTIPRALGVLGGGGAAEEQRPDGAARGRATAMLAAARVFLDNPVLGVGPGQFNELSRRYSRQGGLRAFEEHREAHCLYLELAAENGALGLAAFLGLVGVSLRELSRARRRRRDAGDTEAALRITGFQFAILAYLASAVFLHFSYARYFWLMLALADCCSRLELASGSRDADLRGDSSSAEGPGGALAGAAT